MYSYFNNVNNRDFSLQSECMLLQCHCIPFAASLHTYCSDTATALQRDCNGFAVTLQKACNDFAAGHQATAYS